MFMTRETDYALRILRTLSCGGSFTAGELAMREVLPEKFTYKILKKLEKAGIIRITRGVNGGCSLSCDLQEKSLYDLIEAVEMNTKISPCMGCGYVCEWRDETGNICRIHNQLCEVQGLLDEVLRSKSLAWVMDKPAE